MAMSTFLASRTMPIAKPVPRTSYGTPTNTKAMPSQKGPSIGKQTRSSLTEPTPNMGVGGALPKTDWMKNNNLRNDDET